MQAKTTSLITSRLEIFSGYHHSHYPKLVIVAFWQVNKMLGLVALQADIGIDQQYESGIYFCRFSEDVPLAIYISRQYIINKNVIVRAVTLPLTKSNEQFQMQYSVIYSNLDILSQMVTRNYQRYHVICFKLIFYCKLMTTIKILL